MKLSLTFAQRSELCTNPTAKELFRLMSEKESNLAVAVDVTESEKLLDLARLLGPEIVVLKTHIDILKDFRPEVAMELSKIAKHHGFLIFEDRKFADIGTTVKQQYREGIYRIADWAPITNAHVLPGPGIIEGLREVGLPKGNGLLLLAEMSSVGTLATGEYSQRSVEMAYAYSDFVIGFISQRRLTDRPEFIHMTPGVHLVAQGDSLGQHYLTPEVAVRVNGTDIIIVGRGITGAEDPLQEARRYRTAGWY